MQHDVVATWWQHDVVREQHQSQAFTACSPCHRVLRDYTSSSIAETIRVMSKQESADLPRLRGWVGL